MLRLPEDAKELRAIRILNPISEDLSLMRTTLLPSMINCAVRNFRRGNMAGRFFELARIFLPKDLPLTDYPEERRMLSIGASGDDETFFTVKAAPEAVAAAFGLSFRYEKATAPYFHPGQTAKIFLGEEEIGIMGKLSYQISEELAIEKPVFLVSLDYEALLPHLGNEIRYRPVPKFAAETRDLALVCDEAMTCGELQDAIQSSCKYLSRVTLFDVYRAEILGAGKKSMAFQLVFTPDDHEFTADEIEGYVQKILKKLSFLYGITLR